MSYSKAVIDFGSTPIGGKKFTVTMDTYAPLGSTVLAKVAYVAPIGKDLDEIEVDALNICCSDVYGNSQFDMYVSAMDGSYLHDQFIINYKAMGG